MNGELRFGHARFDQELGRTVPVSLLVHRTRKLAVIANSFIAYRTGFSFILYMVQRNPPKHVPGLSSRPNVNVDHETLDVVDAGGRNLSTEPDFAGHGSVGWMACRYFVLELPAPGLMTVSLDWPGRHSLRVSALLESRPILEAAKKAEPLW